MWYRAILIKTHVIDWLIDCHYPEGCEICPSHLTYPLREMWAAAVPRLGVIRWSNLQVQPQILSAKQEGNVYHFHCAWYDLATDQTTNIDVLVTLCNWRSLSGQLWEVEGLIKTFVASWLITYPILFQSYGRPEWNVTFVCSSKNVRCAPPKSYRCHAMLSNALGRETKCFSVLMSYQGNCPPQNSIPWLWKPAHTSTLLFWPHEQHVVCCFGVII